LPAEDYIEREYPDLARLEPGATTFDHFNPISGQAVSTKTLNTLSMGKIKNPEKIYGEIKDYVDEVLNYERLKESDLDPAMIESKSIYLFVPEGTSPIQWRQLLRALIYGKDNCASIVIIRVRE
jgi:filamentous hemagglutinin